MHLKAIYTMIAEEKIRSINKESQELLEIIRIEEGKGDTNTIKELQKQHQQLLAVKTDLMNTIQ